MNYRFMRMMLFFDLPAVTPVDKREYRHFVKFIKSLGFYRLQESVYVKLAVTSFVTNVVEKDVNRNLPRAGKISILTVTEKQFQSMNTLIGENHTKILDDDKRLIEL